MELNRIITKDERLAQIKRWDNSGKEHDFYEMNLSAKLEKAEKIEDFRNNYLPKLKEVVKKCCRI